MTCARCLSYFLAFFSLSKKRGSPHSTSSQRMESCWGNITTLLIGRRNRPRNNITWMLSESSPFYNIRGTLSEPRENITIYNQIKYIMTYSHSIQTISAFSHLRRCRSKSDIFLHIVSVRFPRYPLKDISVVLSRSKRSRLRRKLIFVEYCDPAFLYDIFSASRFMKRSASQPILHIFSCVL